MPRKGYKTITIDAKIYEDIKKRAREADCTMMKYCEYLMAKEKDAKARK